LSGVPVAAVTFRDAQDPAKYSKCEVSAVDDGV
jgi:hypothetical protein